MSIPVITGLGSMLTGTESARRLRMRATIAWIVVAAAVAADWDSFLGHDVAVGRRRHGDDRLLAGFADDVVGIVEIHAGANR